MQGSVFIGVTWVVNRWPISTVETAGLVRNIATRREVTVGCGRPVLWDEQHQSWCRILESCVNYIGAHKGGRVAGLLPSLPKAKFTKHRFCRHDDIKCFTWFTLRPKSATEIGWWRVYWNIYTGCPRRNVPDFGRVFLMLNYTDITQNT